MASLTRDSRVVERKKYGKAKARRSFQFSKALIGARSNRVFERALRATEAPFFFGRLRSSIWRAPVGARSLDMQTVFIDGEAGTTACRSGNGCEGRRDFPSLDRSGAPQGPGGPGRTD